MLVCISTGVNVRYLLVYEEPWNVNVEIFDGVSVVEECTVLSPEKAPNRLRATIIDQRSAAQYGQYSAPMYSISGFPPEVSGVPPLTGCTRGAVRRVGRRLVVRLDHDEGHHDRYHGDDAARRDEDPPALLGATFGRALGGDLLPAGGVDLGPACLAHARFVQPLRQPAGGLAACCWFQACAGAQE